MGGRVASEVVVERVQRLLDLSKELHERYCQRYIGSEQSVLVERQDGAGRGEGFTENYIRTSFQSRRRCEGEIVRVRLGGERDGEKVRGEIIEGERSE